MKQLSLRDLVQRFPDQDSARVFFEIQRWGENRQPDFCPVCNAIGLITRVKESEYFHCNTCHTQFTVRTGTVMERSHIPLQKWIYATYLFVSSRKGISSVQLAHHIGLTQKSAWFLLQRLREACNNEDMGLFSGIVEVDETYIGDKEKNKHESKKKHEGSGSVGKTPVIGTKNREGKVTGKVIHDTTIATVDGFLAETLLADALLITDEHRSYRNWAHHEVVNHSAGVYVNHMIHTNGIKSVWAVLKRGLLGIYHLVTIKHIQRYISEFTFRLSHCHNTLEEQMTSLFSNLIEVRIEYSEVIG